MFQPLGDRVLIKPLTPPDETESGLVVVKDWQPEQTGTVVAVGRVRHPRKDEAFALAEKLEDEFVAGPYRACAEAADLLRKLTGREPDVQVGDDVVFSWQSGQELWVNHGQERFILVRESDILCVMDKV